MVMKLEAAVPFGRSLDEYRQMFALSDDDLERAILGVADGPASFNTEMTALGKRLVSVDPLYAFSGGDIEKQFSAVVDNIIAQVKATPDDWVWSYHRSPEHLRENRVNVLGKFISDYDSGKMEGRYRVGELPRLDYEDDQFDLALCSHFLFLYSDQYSYEFHQASVYEMLRVAREVRIFPLLSLMLERSRHLQPLVDDLVSQGHSVSVRRVGYELQKGANEMLQITRTV
jgi:hypothetical protein